MLGDIANERYKDDTEEELGDAQAGNDRLGNMDERLALPGDAQRG